MTISTDHPKHVPAIRDAAIATTNLISQVIGVRSWENECFDLDPRLIWLSTDAVGLLIDTAATIPDDILLTEIQRPPAAFVVLEHPIFGTDALTGMQSVRVDALLWGPIRVSGNGSRSTGTSIASYSEQIGIDGPEARLFDGWWPRGRSEWMDSEPLGALSDSTRDHNQPDTYETSAIEDRRLIAALWGLLSAERHIAIRPWKPHNKAQKRRLGNTEVTTVSVGGGTVHHTPTGHPARRTLDHRVWVQPYFRMQPYGPGQSLRRLQLVAGHLKGPDDAPLVRREKVWTLRHQK